MQNDISVWNQSGYTLPYSSLNGNETAKIYQYFVDEAATCNTGETPKGCGATYLDLSSTGSLAGTGPTRSRVSIRVTTTSCSAQTRTTGAAPTSIRAAKRRVPKIGTIKVNFVPEQGTRTLDLQNAANSGQAMTVDVEPDHLYDVAARSEWLTNNTLASIIPGVSIYGPYSSFYTLFAPFSMNVTDSQTGTFYSFQPFADIRMRLAFADSVNMTVIDQTVNNELGQVATNVVPPGLPPAGAYNSSITPRYSFNLTAVQDLLLAAMMHPITNFSFVNGTAAPAGLFNNTFGCTTPGSNGQCSKPVQQSITLTFYTGDTVDEAIFDQIASAINNVSSTYNMGLTVSVVPEPFGIMSTQGFSDELYMYQIGGWGDDYPWVLDFLGPMYAPGQIYSFSDGWNLTGMAPLYQEAVNATAHVDFKQVVSATNEMNELANEQVMYLWTFNPQAFIVMTSNVNGFYFNPSLAQVPTGFYFASLY